VVARVLLWVELAVMLLAMPAAVWLVAMTAWEGGDAAAKADLQTWGLVAVPIHLVTAVACAVLALTVRHSPGLRRPGALVVGLLLVGLTVGWGGAFRRDLGPWFVALAALCVGPGLVGALLVARLDRSRTRAEATRPGDGLPGMESNHRR
jgi:hypothetical protein